MKLPHRAKKPTTPPPLNLSARTIRENLLVSSDGTWAWFALSPVPWAFRSPGDREGLLSNITHRWAELAGKMVHLRVTSLPVPYNEWARGLDDASPNRLPDLDGAETWGDYLRAGQEQIIRSGLHTPAVYMGVRLTTRKMTEKDLDLILTLGQRRRAVKMTTAQEAFHRDLTAVTETMSREGFRGRPVTERRLGWLMHASVALGAPVSDHATAAGDDAGGWGPGDMEAFTEPVRAYAKPLAGCVTLTTSRDGAIRTHHAGFLTLARAELRDTLIPALAPWVGFSQRFGFPVEWSALLEVIPGRELRGRAAFDLTRANSILRGYVEDHGEEPPPEVDRAIADARRIQDEVTNGTSDVATRVAGPIRMAVFGDSEDEVLAKVRAVISTYDDDQRMEVTHPHAQYALYRSFIPGESKHEHRHHVRVLPARFMATAVPNAASGLGDDQGPYLGQVVGSSRSGVMFDPTHGPMHPELNKSGLSVFVAGLGGGKSVGFGAIAESSARRGHRTVVMDPSGPLSALTRLPHLRRHSRHVDLTGAEVGTLNPYRLVPVPLRSNYDTDREYEDAIRESEAERRDLMIDTAWMLLPSQRPDHYGRITQAVGETPAEYGVNPWQFVHRLRRQGEAGAEVATMLEQVSLLKGGLLIFPDTDADQTHRDDVEDAVLNVITMPGLTTPAPGSDPKHWTRAERMSVPMLHLAARYASRVMYADREPKVIGTDEGGIAAAAGSSFKSFALRGSRDSRKHNTYFGLLMQNPSDALEVSDEIDNLLGTAFIGRVTGEGPIAAALKLLGVPRGCGYEKVLPNLEPGEFVMRDYYGRVDKMRVDLGHRPELLAALKTTPPSARVRVVDNTTPYEVGGRR